MESNNTDVDTGEKCNLNGDCAPALDKQPFDLNNAKNIDDISTPSELKFDEEPDYEDPDVKEKKKEIEKCLENLNYVNLEQWQAFAKGKAGLISDDYRRKIWPLLVGVTQEELTDPPSLDELSTHSEYNQVVLDVNRSLKRFPPGIPYEQRVALQDQLTVLILRVIMKYPHLKYYQAVAAHERSMREQAKKMNVASLRSSEAANTNAECKLAKVALMTISLWFMAWTPYLVINYTGVFESAPISPLATIWGSLFAKANAVYNPIVYGISHPKYRAALYKKFPALACSVSPDEAGSVASAATTVTEEKPAA